MTRRGLLAGGVLAAWAGGFALLLARELNPSMASRLAEVALRITPITTYYVAERGGRHVGFASMAFDTVPGALQVTEYVVTAGGDGPRVTDQLVVRLSRGLALREFERVRAEGTDSIRLAGRVEDSVLVVEGGAAPNVPLRESAFLGPLALAVAALLDAPRAGATTALTLVDPASGQSGPAALRVVAESLFVVVDSAVADSSGRWFAVHKDTVRAWRLVTDGPPAMDAWVDAQGLVVEALRPDGLVLRRTAFELAFENWRLANPAGAVSATAAGGIVAGTWLASGVPRPSAVLDSLTIRLGAAVPRDWPGRYGRSWRAGNTLTFARTAPARLTPRYELPGSDRWRVVFARQLARSPWIEAENPAILRRASRLANGTRNPSVVAQRIVSWVADSLRARAGLAPASAATALERKSGDAREFALLTTALLRAAGIPADPVAGLLFAGGRFYLHAWTEVYLGRWVPVDAMLGQFPADAGHLPFENGAVDLGPDLARVLSRLPLTVVRVDTAR